MRNGGSPWAWIGRSLRRLLGREYNLYSCNVIWKRDSVGHWTLAVSNSSCGYHLEVEIEHGDYRDEKHALRMALQGLGQSYGKDWERLVSLMLTNTTIPDTDEEWQMHVPLEDHLSIVR